MKNLAKIIAVLLMAAMTLTLCACGNTGNTPDETDDKEITTPEVTEPDEPKVEITFTVKVVDGENNPVKGVSVQLCKDTCVIAMTDDNGVASFNSNQIPEMTDGYKLSVPFLPAGYEYNGEAEIYMEAGATEYTVEVAKVG